MLSSQAPSFLYLLSDVVLILSEQFNSKATNENRYPTSLTGQLEVIDGEFTKRTTTEQITALEEEVTESAIKLTDDLDLFGEEENKMEYIKINL